ncbi:MAG: lecithin retinol acyltransferase family protein [Deltaproteobacteria bacterium]|nr:lecithin retinol acyltransferase family protein [Deltaproteobacteria bacterium]
MNLLEENLNPGDHIYVRRLLYSHHGIYTGDGTVIHYAGEEKEKKAPTITETDMENFLKDGRLRRRDYKQRLPPSETISLAKKHLSVRGYSLTFNNCEHFATYCATGKKESRQVRNIIKSMVGITLAVTGTIIQIKIKKRGKR